MIVKGKATRHSLQGGQVRLNAWDFLAASLWPTVVMVGLVVYRGPISEFIRKVKSAELPGGTKLSVGEVERARDQATADAPPDVTIEGGAEELVPSNNQDAIESSFVSRASLAELSPPALVMESWRSVENAIRKLFEAATRQDGKVNLIHPRRDPAGVLRYLEGREYFPASLSHLLRELRQFRNAVTHSGEEPTPAAALAYADSADFARRSLEVSIRSSRQRGGRPG